MTYSRILLVRMSALGDVVLTLPCLSVLRKAYPSANISWLVNEAILPLLKGNPMLDDVISFDRKAYSEFANWPKFFGFAHSLKKYRFDLAIDFQGLFRSGYLTYASGASVRVGSAENREGSALFYTHRVPLQRKDYHAVDWQLRFLKGIPEIQFPSKTDVEFSFPDFSFAKESLLEKLQNVGMKEIQDYIVIAPGARWETKRWIPERYSELIDRLGKEFNLPILLAGTMEDKDIGHQIETNAKWKPFNLINNTTLPELVLLLKQAKLMVSNDTGPMHLAGALGTPVVAIFGPTNPFLTGPYGSKNIVVKNDVPCGPCLKRTCPGYGLVCMTEIKVEEVFATASKFLK